MKMLKGRVAPVTGASSLGLAMAKRLQQESAGVATTQRSWTTLDEAGAAIGNEALAIQADVAKLQELGKFYAEISQKLGKIDLLFAEETLDVCAVDGFILEILETLRSWKRRDSGPKCCAVVDSTS
jgi:short-subunit dehydrogenase involved in D-alanine esterification of teichoic acids